MPEATSNDTTISTSDHVEGTPIGAASTRRSFLSTVAGVAAGGSVLALAAVSASAGAAAPTAALASPDDDPIFGLIEEYRAAGAAVAAAASDVSRREEMLIEEGLGLYPVVCVVDHRLIKPATVMVYRREDIDQMAPPDRFPKANAEAKAALDLQIKRHAAINGDGEKLLNEAYDVEMEALDTLVWTGPSTIAGVLALLEMWPELQKGNIDDDQAEAMMASIITVLQDAQPNTTVTA